MKVLNFVINDRLDRNKLSLNYHILILLNVYGHFSAFIIRYLYFKWLLKSDTREPKIYLWPPLRKK